MEKNAHNQAEEALKDAMSQYSEAHYCAAWLYNVEVLIWEALQKDDPAVAHIGALAEKAGGWAIWDEHNGCIRVVTKLQWLAIYPEKKKRIAQERDAIRAISNSLPTGTPPAEA